MHKEFVLVSQYKVYITIHHNIYIIQLFKQFVDLHSLYREINLFISALMGVAELAKGIQYEDPIKTGSVHAQCWVTI